MRLGNAIEVNHVTKCFKVYLDKGRTLKEKILFQNRRKYEKRTVLNDISFCVKHEEEVGLIGQNGCGKSTTLKLLTRIMYPDSGTIEMDGRVSSLIELGAGFHPDMSGRQNIYINASIFGLTRKEIDARLNDIIAFSELEEFIDNPVRTYSSGMYMRLAFSVAINVDADILLIDEILAVGDANFQSKCFQKMFELKKRGITIVLVSHDLQSIEKICDRSIWIDGGEIREEGLPFHVNNKYLKYMERKSDKDSSEESFYTKPNALTIDSKLESWGNKKVYFKEVYLRNYHGNSSENDIINSESELVIELVLGVNINVEKCMIGIGINDNMGNMIFGTNTDLEQVQVPNIRDFKKVLFCIPHIHLIEGDYSLHASITDGKTDIYDWYPIIKTFHINNEQKFVGTVFLTHNWKFE